MTAVCTMAARMVFIYSSRLRFRFQCMRLCHHTTSGVTHSSQASEEDGGLQCADIAVPVTVHTMWQVGRCAVGALWNKGSNSFLQSSLHNNFKLDLAALGLAGWSFSRCCSCWECHCAVRHLTQCRYSRLRAMSSDHVLLLHLCAKPMACDV